MNVIIATCPNRHRTCYVDEQGIIHMINTTIGKICDKDDMDVNMIVDIINYWKSCDTTFELGYYLK